MDSLGWKLENINISLSVKRDAFLILMLYLFNCFIFSAYPELSQVVTKPWLLLVWIYGLATLVPLFWRNSAPVTVFATQWAAVIVAWPILSHYSPVVGIPVALYAIAVHCSGNIYLLALLASFIPNGLVAAAAGFAVGPGRQLATFVSSVVFLALMAAGACGAGRLARASEQHIKHLEREQAATRDAEVLAVERRKIARELHDSVSHAVTVIVLLAAGAARIANTDFAQVKQSLANIEATAKQAMAELRTLLAVLNSDSTNRAAGTDGRRPQLGLASLAMLLASLPTTGRPVTVHIDGTPRDLAPSVDLAAYRIIQEGLTNVLKHAGKDANPQLRLVWETQSLLIQIDNGTHLKEAAHSLTITGGWGLNGLRERAHAVGGHLDAGPHRGAGYRLVATLPLATSTSPSVPSTIVPHASIQDHENQEKV